MIDARLDSLGQMNSIMKRVFLPKVILVSTLSSPIVQTINLLQRMNRTLTTISILTIKAVLFKGAKMPKALFPKNQSTVSSIVSRNTPIV